MSKSDKIDENKIFSEIEKNLGNIPGLTILPNRKYDLETFPLFPSIIILREIPDFSEIQNDLVEWIYRYKKKYPTGIKESSIGGWQSSDDIFEQRSFLTYGSILSSEITIMLNGVFNPKKVDLSSGWININPPNSFNKSHVHPNSDISGLLVVKNSPDSAIIEFENPCRFGQDKFLSSLNENVSQGFYATSTRSFNLEEGYILLFPSDLRCSVYPNSSDSDFVSIWFNLDIKNDL